MRTFLLILAFFIWTICKADDPDYTGWCGKQNLVEAITERFGCSESDIEVEEDDVEDNMEDNEH